MSALTVEEEICDNIFHDPKFFDYFLSGPATKLDAVLRYCRKSNVYIQRTNSWNPTSRVTRRSGPEQPLLKLLNTIVRGAHATGSKRTDPPAGALFVDCLTESIEATGSIEKHGLPEFLLSDEVTRDWPGVRTAVKLMRLPGHRKMGMVHLARYAKTMFTRQPHRRHIYHLMICGTEATFVRFDRAGVLYSSIVDLCKDAETFIRALASLVMLDRVDEGFIPYFSAKKNADKGIVYYADLPREIFWRESEPGSTQRLKVTKILRSSSDIVGCATNVLLLREVLEPTKRDIKPIPTRGKGKRKRVEAAPVEEEERLGDSSYVMKISWRNPYEINESDLYAETNGMYGLGQRIWDADARGACTCTGEEEECPCVAEVGPIEGLEVCDALSNLVFSKEEFDTDGDDKEGPELDTSKYRPATSLREHRICAYILMSSIGKYLGDAETPRYWRLFNLGYLHRDISDGNVMMLQPGQVFREKEWEKPVWDLSKIQDEEIRKSEEKLREVIAKLGRDPVGMLVDFDRCVEHSGNVPVKSKSEIEFHGRRKRAAEMCDFRPRKRQRPNATESYAFRDTSEPPSDHALEFRTGTTPFMSASVSGATYGKPYRHSYLDDLESFFWLIYTSAFTHVDRGKKANSSQREELRKFFYSDMNELARVKADIIDRGDRIFYRLDRFNNSWSKSYVFKKVLLTLEEFFRDVWEDRDPGMTPVEAFTTFTGVMMAAITGPLP